MTEYKRNLGVGYKALLEKQGDGYISETYTLSQLAAEFFAKAPCPVGLLAVILNSKDQIAIAQANQMLEGYAQ